MNVSDLRASDSSSPWRIFIITERTDAVESLAAFLCQEGFEVDLAGDLKTAVANIQTRWPSLVILDLEDGTDMSRFCRTMKGDRGTSGIPIIVMTAANRAQDRIAGLEAGADDCVGWPSSSREIMLRIKAVLRRTTRSAPLEQFVRGPISMDAARCRVAVNNHRVHLTAVEFKLLRKLVKQPGQTLSREALHNEARGTEEALASRTVDTHIRRLRRKLGKAAHLVETVRGSGYRLRPT